MLTWGIVMTLTGIVQNFAGLFVTRFLLGVAGKISPRCVTTFANTC